MILFILLLHIAVLLAAPPRSSIDWDRCVDEATCFIEGKCGNVESKYAAHYSLEISIKPKERLVDQKCNIGVQFIQFSFTKVLIYIQVNGEILKNRSIGLYQDKEAIVGCRENDKGEVEVFNHPTFTNTYKPVLYEDFSKFDDEDALCVILVDRFKPAKWKKITEDKTLTKLLFYPQNPQSRPTNAPAGTPPHGTVMYAHPDPIYETMVNRRGKLCDPEPFKQPARRDKLHVLPIKDPSRLEPFDCSNYNNANKDGAVYDYKLFIQQGDEIQQADNIFCDTNSKIFKATNTTGHVTDLDQSDFTAYCATEIFKTCENPLPCKTGDNCPEFVPGSATANATLKCNRKWLINNEYYNVSDPECKEDEIIQNKGSFYITLPGVNGTTVTKPAEGECYTEYDCLIKSKVDISTTVNTTLNKLYCKEGILRVKSDNKTFNATEYTCHTESGTWRNGDVVIPPYSRVLCEKEAPAQSDALMTPAQQTGYGIGILLVALAIVIAIFVGICKYKQVLVHNSLTQEMRIWEKLTPDQKREYAANTFRKANNADSVSAKQILIGLELIETMLMAETEDPAIWELAYPFLNRLHGSSRRMGNKLTKLITRYLFVEAKKIIDTHGWISPKRITQAKKKSYIRTIAIRLIYYCRFSEFDEEVTKFIAEGFAQLHVDAVEQYPHCGMLWPHVATCRNKAIQKQFLEQMARISSGKERVEGKILEIDEAKRIPQIGSISDQANEALGASLFWELTHFSDSKPDISQLRLSHIRGIIRSSQHDMGVILRKLFNDCTGDAIDENYHTLMTILKKEKMEMADFIEQVMEVQACYSQQHDAMRLETVFNLVNAKGEKDQGNGSQKEAASNAEPVKETTSKAEPAPRLEAGNDAAPKVEKLPGERYKRITAAQNAFDAALFDTKDDIKSWLGDRQSIHKVKNPKTKPAKKSTKLSSKSSRTSRSVKGTETFKESSNKAETVKEASNKAETVKETSSKVETVPRLGAGNDETYHTKLLEKPTEKKRIRTCQATEEEQKKYRELLDQIFAQDTLIAARVNFAPDDVVEVMSQVKKIIETEPMLIEDIPGGITVVSDLHGQLYTLHTVFNTHSKDGKPGYECAKFLFLGDFVDRGYMALELIMALFILKILYPDRFIILKGNHEFLETNKQYSFIRQIYGRYEEPEAEYLYAYINECFAYLSIAGIIGNKFFCAHGGISMGSFTRQEFRKLEKPYLSTEEDPLVNDVVWTDPGITLKGVCYNNKRGCGMFFGEEEFIHAMEKLECEGMIRGHQVVTEGQKVLWGRLICIFTQTAVKSKNMNDGAIAIVDEEMNVKVHILEYDESGYDLAQTYREQRIAKQKIARAEREKDGKFEIIFGDEEDDWDDAVELEVPGDKNADDDGEDLTTKAFE